MQTCFECDADLPAFSLSALAAALSGCSWLAYSEEYGFWHVPGSSPASSTGRNQCPAASAAGSLYASAHAMLCIPFPPCLHPLDLSGTRNTGPAVPFPACTFGHNSTLLPELCAHSLLSIPRNARTKSYQVLYCVPLVHTSCDRKHKSGKAAPGTFSPAQSEGIPEYCSELLEVRGRMLADRADEVCGKLLMRIDIAADYADPADLLLAFFLLLLGLRLDVLKIVAVAY